jgi:hypothetical protein
VPLRGGAQVQLTHRGPAGCDSDEADVYVSQLVYHQRCGEIEQIRSQAYTSGGFDVPLYTVDTSDGSRAHDPEFTADGGHVQFMSCLSALICIGSDNIAVMTTEGTGLQTLTRSGGVMGDPHYFPSAPSPDGRTFALVSALPNDNDTATWGITTGRQPPVTVLYFGAQPAVDPDWQTLS